MDTEKRKIKKTKDRQDEQKIHQLETQDADTEYRHRSTEKRQDRCTGLRHRTMAQRIAAEYRLGAATQQKDIEQRPMTKLQCRHRVET